MKVGNEVLRALSELGKEENLRSISTLEHLEQFVVQLYGGSSFPPNIHSLAELRWHLFAKFQQEAEQLPPTFGAFKYKVFRSHFVTMVRAHLPIQNLPPTINYGWENVDSSLNPILTHDLPAPLALIELSVCACKSDCSTNRCKCRKNGFVCTDMCKCKLELYK